MARNTDKAGKSDEDERPKAGRPPTGRKPTRTIFARVPTALGKALDAYLEGLRVRPTMSQVVITALEDFLRGEGLLPPEEESE